MEEKQRLKLKKLIKELEKIRGRHTELVSVYIPAGYNLTEISNQLFQEKSTAMNIKSKTTRKNVLAALEKIIQHLKLFKQTPSNGLIVFCGNVSPVEGKEDIQLWSIEPPEPMNVKLYWCNQVFVLDPLKELVKEREVYGLIVLDTQEASIGLLKGKKVLQVRKFRSLVPGKTAKGGFSQMRFQRVREGLINDFLKKVGEQASEIFLTEKNLKGVIIGGPGPIKEQFARGDFLNYQVKQKLLGVKDTSYTGEYGLKELVKRAEDLLAKATVVKERQLLDKFFSELKKGGNVVYGVKETVKALEAGALDILLISEKFDWLHVRLGCSSGHMVEKNLPVEKIDRQTCDICGGKMSVKNSEELAELLIEKAKAFRTKVEFVSTDTEEGIEFSQLGGIGGFLRYKI